MKNVTSILFEETPGVGKLFNSQMDLVMQIMQVPDTEYSATPDDIEHYSKTQNRLRTYVSQLLSQTVMRNVTPGFEMALEHLIHKKIEDPGLANRLFTDVITELKSKKIIPQKNEAKQSELDQLIADFRNGKYISIITAKPLEIEAEISDQYSLRKLVFEDFIESIISPEKPIKCYRFNFPSQHSGMLFWLGLYKLLYGYLKEISDKRTFVKQIQKKAAVSLESNSDLFHELDLADIDKVAWHVLQTLDKEQKIMVLTSDAPIYTLPLIVIDPAEIKSARIYAITDSKNNSFNVYKFSTEEVFAYRLSVWDKLQFPKYRGEPIPFTKIFSV